MAKGFRLPGAAALGAALRGDVVGRARERTLQNIAPGTAWQTYPAKVGRWTRVVTDSYTGLGKTLIVFVWIADLIGALSGLSDGTGSMTDSGSMSTRPAHWRLKKKVWQVDPRHIQLLDPQTGQPVAAHLMYAPYTALPGAQGFNTDPAHGVVTVQYLGDPRGQGLVLPYGIAADQAIPTLSGKFAGSDSRTLAVGPWFLDAPQPPVGRKAA
jgi:hypothetical protein